MMRYRYLLFFKLVALLLISRPALSQDCNFYETLTDTVWRKTSDAIRVSDETIPFDIKGCGPTIYNKLKERYSKDIADSLYGLINKSGSSKISWHSCSDKIRFLNHRKLKRALKYNLKNKSKEWFYSMTIAKQGIWYFSNSIIYNDFAIVQVANYVSSFNSLTGIWFLVKGNDNTWHVAEYFDCSWS